MPCLQMGSVGCRSGLPCLSACPLPCRARARLIICSAQEDAGTRREILLSGLNVGMLASLFTFGAAPRPSGLGVKDYSGFKSLSLCPATKNCISTAEEANDVSHYVPPWSYNPEDRRGSKKSKSQAMDELVQVITASKPDNFEPKLVKRTDDYVYAEYQSPTFGFVDDVEFYFPPDKDTVEYRSASRIGESDGDINRKRIKALRQALEKKGWQSIGF